MSIALKLNANEAYLKGSVKWQNLRKAKIGKNIVQSNLIVSGFNANPVGCSAYFYFCSCLFSLTLSAQKFMYYVNDGVYGSFNCILYDHAHPVPRPLMPPPEGCDQYECSIWGPTCDGLDQVFEYGTLPELAVGAWVVFENMGAYTVCAASSFNGFQKPKAFYYCVEERDSMERNGGSVGPALETPAGPLDVHWLQGMLGQRRQNSGHLCTN